MALATREDPRLGLHRLRLSGQLTELRGRDLRFSMEETAGLLRGGLPAISRATFRAPEIAAELFVSLNTVRTRLRHIYGKLGVHGRAEAVEPARRLGLLAPSHRRR